MVKTCQTTSSPMLLDQLGWYFAESILGSSLYKIAILLWSENKQTLIGRGKFAKISDTLTLSATSLVFHAIMEDNVIITVMVKITWQNFMSKITYLLPCKSIWSRFLYINSLNLI